MGQSLESNIPALRCLAVDEKSAAMKFITAHKAKVLNQIVEVDRALGILVSLGQQTLRGQNVQIQNLKEQLKTEKEKASPWCVGNDLLRGNSFDDAVCVIGWFNTESNVYSKQVYFYCRPLYSLLYIFAK